MTFQQWIQHGIDNGYCNEPTCIMHDGTPFDEHEAALFENGEDPCVVVLKLVRETP